MIVDLPDTTTSAISKALVKIREESGAVALGRVLTLVIATPLGDEEEAIEAANDASREHPMRVIVLVARARRLDRGAARLDAEIRVGGDAGASEVIVLRAYGDAASDEEGLVTGLLLPDAPVVVWWPGERARRVRATSPLGSIAHTSHHRRRRPSRPAAGARPLGAPLLPRRHRLRLDAAHALARTARRRARPAAVRAGHRRRGHAAPSDSPSTELLAAWLQQQLRCPSSSTSPTRSTGSAASTASRSARVRPDRARALDPRTSRRCASPTSRDHDISLPRRSLRDCLAEELRRLDPDDLYGEVIQNGLGALERPGEEAEPE